MVLKCCVTLCKGNYASSSKRVPVYKLPQYEKKKKKWISVIPRANLVVSKYTAVCGKHWPNDAEMANSMASWEQKIHSLFFPEFLPSCLSSQLSNSCKAYAFRRQWICDALMVFHRFFEKGVWKITRRFRSNLLYIGIGCYSKCLHWLCQTFSTAWSKSVPRQIYWTTTNVKSLIICML